jgi:hypothetical protein
VTLVKLASPSLTKTWNKTTALALLTLEVSTVLPVTLMFLSEVGKPWAALPCSAAIKTLFSTATKVLSTIVESSEDFWRLITGNLSQNWLSFLNSPQLMKVLFLINEFLEDAPPK